MAFSRAEIIGSGGKYELSLQAKELLDNTFASLKDGAAGRSLVADDRSLIEANGKTYLLVDYLYQDKINKNEPYLYTVERQGRVFELALDRETSKYNGKIAFSDQWKMSWEGDGSGGLTPTGLEDYSRGLTADANGNVYMYGSNGILKNIINSTEANDSSTPESMLNKYGLSAQAKSGLKDGSVSNVVRDSYYGTVIAFNTYSGGNSLGDIYWPEFTIVAGKGGENDAGNKYVFSKSQNSYPSDIVISEQKTIYAIYEGFETPPNWSPLSANAYYEVKNPQRLARISVDGSTKTVDLPGVNDQMATLGKSHSLYQYSITKAANSEVWLTEERYDFGSNSLEVPISRLNMRAWRAESILKDKGAQAQFELNIDIPKDLISSLPSFSSDNFKTYGLGEYGEINALLLISSQNQTIYNSAQALFEKISQFNSNIYGSQAKNAGTESPRLPSVDNQYAKMLIGESLTGFVKLGQNSYDAKFYNLGGGRYGVQQKGKSTIDEITGTTYLQFQDQTISLASDVAATFNQVKGIDDVSGVVFRLYNAAFARLPDANGLENWINGNKSGGQTYASSALEFAKSQEFKNRYGSNVSDTQYVTTLYKNVLGRDPDAGGLAHYQGLLASGKDRGSLLLDFSESPENHTLFTKVTGLS